MSKMYLSCETLDNWFDEYNTNKTDWTLPEIIGNLQGALADTNILMIGADKSDMDRFKNINDAIVSALRDLSQLLKEAKDCITNGDILVQKGGAK